MVEIIDGNMFLKNTSSLVACMIAGKRLMLDRRPQNSAHGPKKSSSQWNIRK